MTLLPFEVQPAPLRTPREVLVALRRARQLTLVAAAQRLGISKSELGRIENGQRQVAPERLAAMAGLYGVPLDHLEKLLEAAAQPQLSLREGPHVRTGPSPTSGGQADRVALMPGLFPPGTMAVVDRAATVTLGDHVLPPEPDPREPLQLAYVGGQLVGLAYNGTVVITRPLLKRLTKVIAIVFP